MRHFLREKLIISAFESSARHERIFDLMATYQNVPMSFADACLVCLAEAYPGSVIFTLDRDFPSRIASRVGVSFPSSPRFKCE